MYAQIIEDNSEVIKLVEDVRPGSFVYKDGKLGKAVSKYNPDLDDHELVMEPLETSGVKAKRLISLISVRDACRTHIQTQLETEGNDPRFLASLNNLNEVFSKQKTQFRSFFKFCGFSKQKTESRSFWKFGCFF